jgi:hypothetical protein
MNLQDHIVQIALSQVGVREASENNTGVDIVKYQKATWLEPNDWPWCAAFTAWVLQMACKNSGRSDVKLCPDASAYGWEKWGKKHGWLLLPETEPCKPGDFVTFDFSHIGIVVEDKGKTIVTVEGNTNGKGERDSVTGDGVWKKERVRSLVKTFIRIPG